MKPALRIIYVERGPATPPVIWRNWGRPDDDPVIAGRDVHRLFGLLLDRAGMDTTNEHGRVVSAARTLLAETAVDQAGTRRLRATVVVSGIGWQSTWTGPCALQASTILREFGLVAPPGRIRAALLAGWREATVHDLATPLFRRMDPERNISDT